MTGRHVPTLFVSSAGGHFEELRLLRQRFGVGPEESTWVTWETPQTLSALGSEDWIRIKPSHPRDWRRTISYTVDARRILRSHRWDRVVSTGALVAVPFLTVARAYGIECHYIESAARTMGPSLSGRILDRVPGVHCYAQSGTWATSRPSWECRGSVFDAFRPEGHPPGDVQRVVVSLGTSRYGFPRLIRALRDILPGSVDVTWQVGATDAGVLGAQARTQMPQDELRQAMREADVVIAHAGVGTALLAMESGHCPVLVPRRADRGEHVDNHQAEIATQLAESGLAVRCEPEELSLELLTKASGQRVNVNRNLPEFVLADC